MNLLCSYQWSVTEKCPVRSTKMNIGLQFDHQKWTQVQDKCTMTGETNQKEIKEFRQFWGITLQKYLTISYYE